MDFEIKPNSSANRWHKSSPRKTEACTKLLGYRQRYTRMGRNTAICLCKHRKSMHTDNQWTIERRGAEGVCPDMGEGSSEHSG